MSTGGAAPFEPSGRGGGVVVRVRVQPRSSRAGVVGLHGGALKVAVTAAPVDGRANAAVAIELARTFGVRASAVTLVAGATSRDKRFAIAGIDLATAQAALGALSPAAPHR